MLMGRDIVQHREAGEMRIDNDIVTEVQSFLRVKTGG